MEGVCGYRRWCRLIYRWYVFYGWIFHAFCFFLFSSVRVNNDEGFPLNILWGIKIKFKICKLILKYWSWSMHMRALNWPKLRVSSSYRLVWTGLNWTGRNWTWTCNWNCFINVDWVAAYVNSCENGEYFIYLFIDGYEYQLSYDTVSNSAIMTCPVNSRHPMRVSFHTIQFRLSREIT